MALAPYFITDLETGGFVSDEHQITEIAVIVASGTSLAQQTTFQSYIQPYAGLSVTKEALDASGVAMADIMNGAKVKSIVDRLIELSKEYKVGRYGLPVLVGHNLQGFDIHFYEKLFELHKKDLYDYFSNETQDTLGLSKLAWGADKEDVTKFKLEMCCARAGIKLSNAHSAMNDTRATYKLFKYLVARLRNISADNPESKVKEDESPRKAFKF